MRGILETTAARLLTGRAQRVRSAHKLRCMRQPPSRLRATFSLMFCLVLAGCAGLGQQTRPPSILVDLDPASVDRTVIIESITASRDGLLYVADRVSGNVMRIDPKMELLAKSLVTKVLRRIVTG